MKQKNNSKTKKICQLNKRVEDLEKSINYTSSKTDESVALCEEIKENISKNSDDIAQVFDKTRDLEDRSRRDNLVFFNVEETNDTNEDCEKLVMSELVKCGIFSRQDVTRPLTERAHRLGNKRRGDGKPRPIIVKMSSHRDKQHIIHSAKKLANVKMNVSEDYSKETVNLHTLLRSKAKAAKEQNDSNLKSYKVTYRRLVVRYADPQTNWEYSKTFTIGNINENPTNWYKK